MRNQYEGLVNKCMENVDDDKLREKVPSFVNKYHKAGKVKINNISSIFMIVIISWNVCVN
jgi:hypothetical protein